MKLPPGRFFKKKLIIFKKYFFENTELFFLRPLDFLSKLNRIMKVASSESAFSS